MMNESSDLDDLSDLETHTKKGKWEKRDTLEYSKQTHDSLNLVSKRLTRFMGLKNFKEDS